MALDTEMIPLPTQQEVQNRYDAAKAAGVSPCMWFPPEWADVKTDSKGKGILPNNSQDDGAQFGFKNPDADEEARERIREGNAKKDPEGPELPPKIDNWANPFSDFTHVDESEYQSAHLDVVSEKVEGPMFQEVENISPELRHHIQVALCGPPSDLLKEVNAALRGTQASLRNRVRKALSELATPSDLATLKADVNTALHGNIPLRNKVTSALEKAPPTPSELVRQVDTVLDGNRPLRDKVKQALTGDDAVGRLKRIVGPGSPGMKRLGLIFEWALHRATVLMGDINAALDKGAAGQNDYELARGNYIKFLRDLDDHEPERKGRKLEVKVKDQPSGYGRSLKWACIDPVIFGGRIVGARVIIHWNPHSSSNGIPIQHP